MPKEEPGKKTPRGKVAADIVRQVRRALELMDKTQNEIADEIDAAKEGLNRLDPDDPEYAAKEEMLQEQAYMAKTSQLGRHDAGRSPRGSGPPCADRGAIGDAAA